MKDDIKYAPLFLIVCHVAVMQLLQGGMCVGLFNSPRYKWRDALAFRYGAIQCNLTLKQGLCCPETGNQPSIVVGR